MEQKEKWKTEEAVFLTRRHLPDDVEDGEVQVGAEVLRLVLALPQGLTDAEGGVLDHGVHGLPLPETEIPQDPQGEATVFLPQAPL